MIYCVEDDESIREIEVYALRATGFEAQGLPDGAALFAAIDGGAKPELILLDIMMPGDDGVTVLKRMRASGNTTPVIMATAKGEEYDKVRGLDLGADDYLVKPFGMMEMVSRVRAVLRRATPGGTQVLRAGALELDEAAHTVKANGELVALALKEYELLATLMRSPGVVFTRDRLLSEIWGFDYDGETRTVDVHVRTLRQKLGAAGDIVSTVRGVGYKLDSF